MGRRGPGVSLVDAFEADHLQGTLREFLRNYEGIFDQQDWAITHCVEQGDLMLCEGIEMLYDRANQKVIRNPSMQAIEFHGGKVAKMRDHYDGSVVAVPERKPAAGSRL